MVTVYAKSIVASKLRKLGKIKGHFFNFLENFTSDTVFKTSILNR